MNYLTQKEGKVDMAQQEIKQETQYTIELSAFSIGYILGLLARDARENPDDAKLAISIAKDVESQFNEQSGNTSTHF